MSSAYVPKNLRRRVAEQARYRCAPTRGLRDVFDPPIDRRELPAEAGSYVLELRLDAEIAVRAGRLGKVRLGPGLVRYYGSARGPGGIRARVARHLGLVPRRPRWHVDALTSRVPVIRVLVSFEATEHELVAADLAKDWRVAVRGFGSSDCRTCPAHLLALG